MGSLTTDIASEIGKLITDGFYLPGNKLTEIALMDRFAASRGTIRTALRSLAADGLVEIHDNRGASVKAPTLRDVLELYDLRCELTAYAAGLIAELGEAATIGGLSQLHDSMRVHVEASDAPVYYQMNLNFHAALLEGCGNRRAAMIYDGLVRESHLHRQPQLSSPTQIRQSFAEHQGILDAIKAGDSLAAAQAARAHVRHGKSRYFATFGKTQLSDR